jgi:16S rRNA C967 or C1407 C5-methylase (RsmB/RsmF family)
MDPIIASARSAVEGIKQGLEVGKKTEEVMEELLTFVNSSADAKFKNDLRTSLKNMVLNKKTVEQEAVTIFMRRKEIESMEDELREYVCKKFGPESWNEIMRIQADIKAERNKLERKKKLDRWLSNGLFIAALSALCVAYVYYK